MNTVKPPLGVLPAWLFYDGGLTPAYFDACALRSRQRQLLVAIRRYEDAGVIPPVEWRIEIEDIESELNQRVDSVYGRHNDY